MRKLWVLGIADNPSISAVGAKAVSATSQVPEEQAVSSMILWIVHGSILWMSLVSWWKSRYVKAYKS